MGITIDDEYYPVPRGKLVVVAGTRVNAETDLEMQRRVQATVTKLNEEQARA